MRPRWRIAALLLGLPLLAGAQLAPSPDAPPLSTAPAPRTAEAPGAALKRNTGMVELYFTVRDKAGNLVTRLNASDCAVLEDGRPQPLTSFAAATRQPLALGVLLDTSGGQSRVLPLEQDAGSQFLERALEPGDEAFLLSFDVDVDLLQDYTANPRLLARAMTKAEINTAGGDRAAGIPGAGGGTVPAMGKPRSTLLYDAVYLAASQKMNQETGRKALLLLTDGEDKGSRATLGEAIAEAQKYNIIVYAILVTSREVHQMTGYGGYAAMKKMTGETGGRLLDAGSDGKKLEAAFQQIENELRTQYMAAYTPADIKLDGGFRRLAVQCRGDGTKVRVRKGYFAPMPRE